MHYTGLLKRAATFKASESEKQALNKPCNLMHTQSKSTAKQVRKKQLHENELQLFVYNI